MYHTKHKPNVSYKKQWDLQLGSFKNVKSFKVHLQERKKKDQSVHSIEYMFLKA